MTEKKSTDRERFGMIATDPLRFLGLRSMMAVDASIEMVPVERVTTAALRGFSLVIVDASSTGLVSEMVGALRRACSSVRLIVLGLESDPAYIEQIIGSGAKGYLTHTATEAEIRMAISVVLDGSIWAPRKVLARLIDKSLPAGQEAAVRPALTQRETDVLRLLVTGSSNREVGRALGIDEATVKAHVGRLMRKVGVTNRTALCVEATRRELLESDSTAGRELLDVSGGL